MLPYMALLAFTFGNALATYMLWYNSSRRVLKWTVLYFFLSLPIGNAMFDVIYYVGVKPGMATVVYIGLLGVSYVFVSGFIKKKLIKA